MTFVKINRILRSRGIYRSDIAKKVKALTKEFAKLYPEPRYLASNFYVFLYLPKVMQRYATPANFWLFYYERLNADLKAINTNKNIEKTFFTRFLNNVHAKELFEKVSKPIDMPSDICDELEQLLVSTESSKSKVPTNKTMQAEYEESQDAFELSSYLAKETLEQPDNSDIFVGLEILPPPMLHRSASTLTSLLLS